MQVVSSRSISHRSTSVTKIGRAEATNTASSQCGDFVSDSMLYREPVEDIMKDWNDVAELSRTMMVKEEQLGFKSKLCCVLN